MRVKLPPAAYAPGFGQIAADGRRSERRRRVPVPHALTLEDCGPLQRRYLATRRRGRRAPKGADGAHGAASGARTAGGREADRRDSGDGRARAPRATDFGQRPKDAGGCAPAPAKISALGASRRRARRGEGGSALWARRGKGNDPTRNRTLSFAPRHARRFGQQPGKRPEARRGRAGWAQRPRASPSRGRTGERGQRPSRPDRRRKDGQRARELLPLHHAHQRRRDHASGRRRGGEAGGDGAGRAALGRGSRPPPHAASAEKAPREDAQAASAADVEASAPRRAQIPPSRGSQSFRARPQRCTARAAARRPLTAGRRLGWPDSVSSPSLPFFRGCCGLLCLFAAKSARKGEKTQILGLTCVEHGFILGMGV